MSTALIRRCRRNRRRYEKNDAAARCAALCQQRAATALPCDPSSRETAGRCAGRRTLADPARVPTRDHLGAPARGGIGEASRGTRRGENHSEFLARQTGRLVLGSANLAMSPVTGHRLGSKPITIRFLVGIAEGFARALEVRSFGPYVIPSHRRQPAWRRCANAIKQNSTAGWRLARLAFAGICRRKLTGNKEICWGAELWAGISCNRGDAFDTSCAGSWVRCHRPESCARELATAPRRFAQSSPPACA